MRIYEEWSGGAMPPPRTPWGTAPSLAGPRWASLVRSPDVDSSAVIESKLEELNMLYKVLTVRYEEHSVGLEAEYSNHSNLQVHLSSVSITCFDSCQEVRFLISIFNFVTFLCFILLHLNFFNLLVWIFYFIIFLL